jgi:hypothetical protein
MGAYRGLAPRQVPQSSGDAAVRVVHGQGPVRRPLRRALHIGHDLIVSAAPPRTKFLIVPPFARTHRAAGIARIHHRESRRRLALRLIERLHQPGPLVCMCEARMWPRAECLQKTPPPPGANRGLSSQERGDPTRPAMRHCRPALPGARARRARGWPAFRCGGRRVRKVRRRSR